jgi:hypothetical protein
VGCADHDAFQRRDLLQRHSGQVRAVGEAVEGRVEIGAGVADHIDRSIWKVEPSSYSAADSARDQKSHIWGPGRPL